VITQEENFVIPSKEAIEEACKKFIGEIWQTPPIYSAIKLQGQPAYARARRGEEIKLQPKQVLVKEIKILNIENNCHSDSPRCSSDEAGRSQSVAKNPSADRIPSESRGILHFATAPFRMTKECLPRVKIEVTCGSGVYIRALARDIAKSLGTKGYLEELVRTRIWSEENPEVDFRIENAQRIENF
jgi:tRNA pseudouridine55 synthase